MRHLALAATTLACIAILGAAPARANLITNGDFAADTMDGWTGFNTPNGKTGFIVPITGSFDVTGSGLQHAALFAVGQVVPSDNGEGSGIRQNVTLAGGTITFSASIAEFNGAAEPNGGGAFIALLDGVIQNIVDPSGGNNIPGGAAVRGTLTFITTATPGVHEIGILMVRSYTVDLALPTPFQYVTNINLTEAVAPVPEPATLALLGAGLAGLVAVRRRRG